MEQSWGWIHQSLFEKMLFFFSQWLSVEMYSLLQSLFHTLRNKLKVDKASKAVWIMWLLHPEQNKYYIRLHLTYAPAVKASEGFEAHSGTHMHTHSRLDICTGCNQNMQVVNAVNQTDQSRRFMHQLVKCWKCDQGQNLQDVFSTHCKRFACTNKNWKKVFLSHVSYLQCGWQYATSNIKK